MLWLAECPVPGDQGLVGAILTEDQKVVLMCDSCATVWCAPEEIRSGTCTQPTGPDWETHCRTHVRPGTTKWADREHVDRAGWKNLDWREILARARLGATKPPRPQGWATCGLSWQAGFR
jgi:hypothetical protein